MPIYKLINNNRIKRNLGQFPIFIKPQELMEKYIKPIGSKIRLKCVSSGT